MYDLFICDDEQFHVNMTQRLLKSGRWNDEFQVHIVQKWEELMEIGKPVDVLLMDIDLGNENGIEVVKKLKQIRPQMETIYVTAHSQYCMDAFETDHAYYLLKPLDQEHLNLAMRSVLKRLQRNDSATLTIQEHHQTILIPQRKIHYLESRGAKVYVYTEEKVYIVYGTLAHMMERLDERFARCHQSYAVNLAEIQLLGRDEIKLKNEQLQRGDKIFVSKARYQEIREAHLRYLGSTL